MDNYPDAHTLFSSTWVFFTNLMEVIQLGIVASSIYRGERKDNGYVMFKSLLSFLSCTGMINFDLKLKSFMKTLSARVA